MFDERVVVNLGGYFGGKIFHAATMESGGGLFSDGKWI